MAKAALLLFALCASALAWGIEIPELTGRVVDNASLLSGEGRQRVEDAIIRLEDLTGGQMAVLTVKSLEGQPIEDFSIKVAEKWRIGHKGKDNGAILIVSRDDRKTRLEIGYGWEGFVNDARAGDILRNISPYFRSGDFPAGIVSAVNGVRAYVTGKAVPKAEEPPAAQAAQAQESPMSGLFVLLVMIGLAAIIILPIISKGHGHGYGTYGNDGFWGDGGSSGGGDSGFSGGGGGFGGGGASGDW